MIIVEAQWQMQGRLLYCSVYSCMFEIFNIKTLKNKRKIEYKKQKDALWSIIVPPYGPQSRWQVSFSVSLCFSLPFISLLRSFLITLIPLLLSLLPLLVFALTGNWLLQYLQSSDCSKRESDSSLSTNPLKWLQSDLPWSHVSVRVHKVKHDPVMRNGKKEGEASELQGI